MSKIDDLVSDLADGYGVLRKGSLSYYVYLPGFNILASWFDSIEEAVEFTKNQTKIMKGVNLPTRVLSPNEYLIDTETSSPPGRVNYQITDQENEIKLCKEYLSNSKDRKMLLHKSLDGKVLVNILTEEMLQ